MKKGRRSLAARTFAPDGRSPRAIGLRRKQREEACEMSTLTRREYRGPFGDMIDWLEAPWTILRPVAAHPVRVEDYVRDGRYVVRAELPGIDPAKDVEVTVAKGILTIKADRREDENGKHHSEFHYGSFSRSVTLPGSADEAHIEAVYDNGILEVAVPLADKGEDKAGRKIPVMLNQHIKPT
jgi:HSP20 family protein